jgi:hypothetical protein
MDESKEIAPEKIEDRSLEGNGVLKEDVEHAVITGNVDERKLLWKIDTRLLPPLFILFLLAFLDRTNIGNAKIQGMIKDLKMVGDGKRSLMTIRLR